MTPSQRTFSWLKEMGYDHIVTVERFISPNSFVGAGHRRDMLGAFDALALREGEVAAVQTCGTDWSGHWRKLTEGSGKPGLEAWLLTGQPALLIGWRKLKAGWYPRLHWFALWDLMNGCAMDRHRTRDEWMDRIE